MGNMGKHDIKYRAMLQNARTLWVGIIRQHNII